MSLIPFAVSVTKEPTSPTASTKLLPMSFPACTTPLPTLAISF